MRAAAERENVAVENLPDVVHKEIDRETVAWARQSVGPCVVEGRYLNHVFATDGVRVYLIEFRLPLKKRAERWLEKTGNQCSTNMIKEDDALEDLISQRRYREQPALLPDLIVDTSSERALRELEKCFAR